MTTLVDTPPCPACGQPAAQASVRDLAEHTHEGTYVCAAEHIWTTKWFAIERSA